jgi:hypothetical protein
MKLIFANYSGISFLQEIISPKLNREFGLLEHLQLLVILFIVIISFRKIRGVNHVLDKLFFTGIGLFGVLIFLEEIDYGQHYLSLFVPVDNASEPLNIHNQGNNNFIIRQTSYVIFVILFILLPLLKPKLKKIIFLEYFAANRWIVITFIIYLIAGFVARGLPKIGFVVNESLRGNHQEFEELVAYYLFLLLMQEIIDRDKPPSNLVIKNN